MQRDWTAVLTAAALLVAPAAPAAATAPGDNGVIVFDRASGEDDDQPPRIMTVTPDVSRFETPVEAGHSGAVSPNGRLLAYDVPVPIGASRLAVARADGSGERFLTDGNFPIHRSPAWSPDGSRLVASADGRGLAVIDLVSGQVERSMLEDCSFWDATWSPVANRIAVSGDCGTDSGTSIYAVRPDGTELQQLTADPDPDDATQVDDGEPTWSPDGERLAFHRRTSVPLSDEPTVLQIMVVGADGSAVRALTSGELTDTSPVWSPDGNEIVFERYWDGEGGRIYGIGPDGDGLRRLTVPPSPVRHRPTDWHSAHSATAGACPDDVVSSAGFDDVAGTHAAAVDCAVWHELARGRTQTTYDPAGPVRRDQMASFVARLLERAGVELPDPESQGFADIDGTTHADAVNQLAELGVVRGVDGTHYAPAQPLTRAQTASALVRAYEHASGAQVARVFDEFADDDGSVHETAIDRAAFAGFAAGAAVSRFAPGDAVRRDQMATFLVRTVDRLVRDGLMELPE